MRVLVAPDKLAGTLSAVEAADAIAAGWRREAPYDEIDRVPLSDGGPGFVDVLYAATGGERHEVRVRGPLGEPVRATVLRVGATAYLECAQACGLALTGGRGATATTTYGVGQLLRAALDLGVRRIVVGLGGSATTDGGAGLLAALGAGASVPLDRGGGSLHGITWLRVPHAPAVEIIAATDVDNPLTGRRGAAAVFGAQKGLGSEDAERIDRALHDLARLAGPELETAAGAGAAGGLGYALLLLGAHRRPGLDVVAEAVGLAGRVAAADLVITAEGALDATSAAGKVPVGVARLAAAADRPCLALAGRVTVSPEEMKELEAGGIVAAYSLVDAVGEERALGQPAAALADLAARVARRRRTDIVASHGE